MLSRVARPEPDTLDPNHRRCQIQSEIGENYVPMEQWDSQDVAGGSSPILPTEFDEPQNLIKSCPHAWPSPYES